MNTRLTKPNWFMLFVVLAIAFLATSSMANERGFSWRMDKRYIDGQRNRKFHMLDGGKLTIRGHIEVHEKRRAAPATPETIRIDVVGTASSKPVCSLLLVPDHAVGFKKPFSASCGIISTGRYWLLIEKIGADNPDGDGWHNRGNGTLTTQ